MSLLKVFKIFFVSAFFLLFSYFSNAYAAEEHINFNVDKNYDASARSQVLATLVKTTPSIYFYIEKSWWDSQVLAKQNEILISLNKLASEFDGKIYPILTSVYGSEWKPGVDGENRVTILFHSIKEGVSGYFRSTDEYVKIQIPNSNEREMIYLSLSKIDDSRLKVYLSHEFVHIITFNQKDRLQNVQEEIWLNEARADYSSTILGYDDSFDGSNLQIRIKDFSERPADSLTEWQETKYDYAVASTFTHYLVDHYGISALSDSLKLKSVGINSINEVLSSLKVKESFSEIFANWTIAILINNCSVDLKYCYLNKNLNNFRISPTLNFLPFTGNSSLSVTNITKNWSGNWQKLIGGNGDLKLEFSSLAGLNFKIPYILFNKDNSYSINFLPLDSNQKAILKIEKFDSKYNSLVIIPSLQTKISGFNGLELTYPYTFSVSNSSNALDGPRPENLCIRISSNLYFGIRNANEVKCLQQFLKNQGPEIYPEGLITGYFGKLTRLAVIRFQERYKSEILTPFSLTRGTGFVGALTREKINQLLEALSLALGYERGI